jgi:hypothetical protein
VGNPCVWKSQPAAQPWGGTPVMTSPASQSDRRHTSRPRSGQTPVDCDTAGAICKGQTSHFWRPRQYCSLCVHFLTCWQFVLVGQHAVLLFVRCKEKSSGKNMRRLISCSNFFISKELSIRNLFLQKST